MNEIWPAITYVVAVVVWLIRLEAAVKSTEREQKRITHEFDDMRLKHELKIDTVRATAENKIDNLATSMNEIRVILARIEGRLNLKTEKGE